MGWVGVSRAPFDSQDIRAFTSVPHFSTQAHQDRNPQGFIHDEHEANDNIDGYARPFTCCRRLRSSSPSVIHLPVDMLKSNSVVVRPRLVRARKPATLSNRRFLSTLRPDSSAPPLPLNGYSLTSGDVIPSIGLGTWRANEEEVGKAVKVVVLEELFDLKGNPNSLI